MKKVISISAIMAIISLPAFAGLSQNQGNGIGGSTTCDTSTLGQSENNSTANVEADWTANTININWYIDDEAQNTMAQTTCTYDGTITLPQEPTKTGYTFAGWRLGAPRCSDLTDELACEANTGCVWIEDMDGRRCESINMSM